MSGPWLILLLMSLSLSGANAGEQSISFKPPQMDEEEELSKVLPKQYRCDVCQGTVYQMHVKLNKVEQRRGPSLRDKALKEFEYLEAIEDVCVNSLSGYAIKGVDGKSMISGPGLPADSKGGIMGGGGKWPNRFRMFCQELVGEMGEDELYETYRTSSTRSKFFEAICFETTKDCANESLSERLPSLNTDEEKDAGSSPASQSESKKKKKKKRKKRGNKKKKSEL